MTFFLSASQAKDPDIEKCLDIVAQLQSKKGTGEVRFYTLLMLLSILCSLVILKCQKAYIPVPVWRTPTQYACGWEQMRCWNTLVKRYNSMFVCPRNFSDRRASIIIYWAIFGLGCGPSTKESTECKSKLGNPSCRPTVSARSSDYHSGMLLPLESEGRPSSWSENYCLEIKHNLT